MYNSSEKNIFKYDFFFKLNSNRTGNDSIMKQFIRSKFLFIDYKGRHAYIK